MKKILSELLGGNLFGLNEFPQFNNLMNIHNFIYKTLKKKKKIWLIESQKTIRW